MHEETACGYYFYYNVLATILRVLASGVVWVSERAWLLVAVDALHVLEVTNKTNRTLARVVEPVYHLHLCQPAHSRQLVLFSFGGIRVGRIFGEPLPHA